MSIAMYKHQSKNTDTIQINVSELKSSGGISAHAPRGSHLLSEEEFEQIKDTMSFETYAEYCSTVGTNFTSTVLMVSADEINMKIYNYCDQYFNLYWGNERISPLFPMALSNIETQGRADFDITFCALFPSKYVSIDQIDTFDVTSVFQSDRVFIALTSEYSSRDRGCLQMNPGYGCNNAYLNALMSGTEKDKLSDIDIKGHSGWASGASSQPGDRFYLPDVLMRLQAAMEENIQYYLTRDYVPETEMQLIAMMAISHNSGCNVFSYKNHNKKTGSWYSGQQAFDYCLNIGSPEFVSRIEELANQKDDMYISYKDALKLYQDFYGVSPTEYCSSKVNAGYPIMCIYSYLKLIQAYT